MEKLVGGMPGRHSQGISFSDPGDGCGPASVTVPSPRFARTPRVQHMAYATMQRAGSCTARQGVTARISTDLPTALATSLED